MKGVGAKCYAAHTKHGIKQSKACTSQISFFTSSALSVTLEGPVRQY